MKKSVKKSNENNSHLIISTYLCRFPAISPITSKTTIEAEASAKSDKAVKNARKCYYSTRKNLRRYKKVRNGRNSTDYWSKNKLVFSEIKPDKWDFLSIKNTVCEYYYSKSKLVFAFAYQKKGRKVKEYRAYYMGGKCYRYIGPDKKVHTYGSGKSYERMSGMAKKLYYKGRRNIELAYEANEPIENK